MMERPDEFNEFMFEWLQKVNFYTENPVKMAISEVSPRISKVVAIGGVSHRASYRSCNRKSFTQRNH